MNIQPFVLTIVLGLATAGHHRQSKYNYGEVLCKSNLFYEAQQSGKLPWWNCIPWRGDSALFDKGPNGEDLTGGWYDAGNHVKNNFMLASATTVLTWGLMEYGHAYYRAGAYWGMVRNIKWILDYFIKCHRGKFLYYAQVGDGETDIKKWIRAEDLDPNDYRPAYQVNATHPGSDVVGEAAAAMAAGSILFKRICPTFSRKLLRHAENLFQFAYQKRGKYSDSIPQVKKFYGSHAYEDEIVWAATWLYGRTRYQKYLKIAEANYQGGLSWAFDWDDKNAGYQMLLYKLTKKPKYRKDISAYIDNWLPTGKLKYTPKGLAFRLKWGSLRYAQNTAFLALLAADLGIKPHKYRKFAVRQVHYALGDTGRSFVVGFGKNPPLRPHHPGASCPWPPKKCGFKYFKIKTPNPHVIYGALVGGPNIDDSYNDDRTDFVHNEVACDYNAGFTASVAGLDSLSARGLLKKEYERI